MNRFTPRVLFLSILLVPITMSAAGKSTVRGWLSDEDCATGRANDGRYTGTNPDCAKKCVHDGKKIVLVDPEHKRLLVILNQESATERVGDFVEISGDLDEHAKHFMLNR